MTELRREIKNIIREWSYSPITNDGPDYEGVTSDIEELVEKRIREYRKQFNQRLEPLREAVKLYSGNPDLRLYRVAKQVLEGEKK